MILFNISHIGLNEKEAEQGGTREEEGVQLSSEIRKYGQREKERKWLSKRIRMQELLQ